MQKNISLIVLTLFLFGILVIGGDDASYAGSMMVIDVDNKIDPVSGEKISVKKFSTGYDGKKIWFVSYASLQKFKKNPEKYAKNVDLSNVSYPAPSSSQDTSKTTKKSKGSFRW